MVMIVDYYMIQRTPVKAKHDQVVIYFECSMIQRTHVKTKHNIGTPQSVNRIDASPLDLNLLNLNLLRQTTVDAKHLSPNDRHVGLHRPRAQ
jgi:hypothetical protein